MAEPEADDLAPQGQVHEDAEALFDYLLTDAEDSAPDGCGDCTPTRACENPTAGCYVHAPPLYSGPHGDYTACSVDSACHACPPADDFTPGGTYACPGPERCTDFDCPCG